MCSKSIPTLLHRLLPEMESDFNPGSFPETARGRVSEVDEYRAGYLDDIEPPTSTRCWAHVLLNISHTLRRGKRRRESTSRVEDATWLFATFSQCALLVASMSPGPPSHPLLRPPFQRPAAHSRPRPNEGSNEHTMFACPYTIRNAHAIDDGRRGSRRAV